MTTTFEDFFREHYGAVEARVRASGAADDVAADAAQEAFIRAYPRWWRLRHYHNPAAWVQRVALNVRRDIERSYRRQAALVASGEPQQPLEVHDGSSVRDAVASLPPQQRSAVQAYYTHGMTTAETADQMGISAGAVRFHLSEARSNLRPMLATDQPGQES